MTGGIVLDQRRIHESGTHEELLKQQRRRRRKHSIIVLVVILLAAGAGTFLRKQLPTDVVAKEGHAATASVNGTPWNLILVNRWNRLPSDYKIELTTLSNGQSVDKRIYPALQQMFDDARQAGIYPIVGSGFRTEKKQKSLMREKIADYKAQGFSDKEAKEKARAWVAPPGTSEHQLGLGVDINADGIHSTGDQVYQWMEQNSYKYGFIRRYPPEKTEITGVINEPWHFRYVGTDVAAQIHDRGVALEEYLDNVHN